MSACPQGLQTKVVPNSVNYSFEGPSRYQVIDAQSPCRVTRNRERLRRPSAVMRDPAQLSDPYVPSKQLQVRWLLPHPEDNSIPRVTFLSREAPTIAQPLKFVRQGDSIESLDALPRSRAICLPNEQQMLKVTRSLLMFAVGVGAALPTLASANPKTPPAPSSS
jgi:hypothetical protein